MKAGIIISLILFCSWSVQSQIKGCTDPRAKNYNSSALVNDGSCEYNYTLANPEVWFSTMPDTIREASGMIFFNSLLWFHNDSGNDPILFGYDTSSGKITSTISIQNYSNIDWEDITQDSSFIYIGDFGNNMGNRKNLSILKINKKDIIPQSNSYVNAQKIQFYYPDQIDFSANNRNHNFDCEAMISLDDSLFLFTKNWVDQKTRIYSIPKVTGTYSAYLKDSFNSDGLITSAIKCQNSNEIILLGYKNYIPFIWLLFDFTNTNFLSGNKRKIDLSLLPGTQTEAIVYINKENIFISNEYSPLVINKLYKLETGKWTKSLILSINNHHYSQTFASLYPNPVKDSFKILFKNEIPSEFFIKIINSESKELYSNLFLQNLSKEVTINLSNLGLTKGEYFLIIYYKNKFLYPFIKE